MSKELEAKDKMDKWILKHIDDVRYHMESLAYDDNLPVRKLPKGFKLALAEQIRKNLDLGLDVFDSTVMNYRSSEFRVFVDDYSGVVVVDVLYPVSGEYFRIGKYYIDSFIYYYQPRSELVAPQSDITDTAPQEARHEVTNSEPEADDIDMYEIDVVFEDGYMLSYPVNLGLHLLFSSALVGDYDDDFVVMRLHHWVEQHGNILRISIDYADTGEDSFPF